jgi:hypothetical protein
METAIYDSGAVVAVIGWVNLIRRVVPDAWSRWMPIVAVACGCLYSLQVRPLGASGGILPALMAGVTVGLSAAGAYAGTKKLSGA